MTTSNTTALSHINAMKVPSPTLLIEKYGRNKIKAALVVQSVASIVEEVSAEFLPDGAGRLDRHSDT